MSQIKQHILTKAEEVHAVLHTFSGVGFDPSCTHGIVAKCPSSVVAREVTQTLNNRAIQGVRVITSGLFPTDVYISINLH